MVDFTQAVACLKPMDLSAVASQASQGTFMAMEMGGSTSIPSRLFSHETAVLYLVPQEDGKVVVTQDMYEPAGITDDQLHDLAMQNLRTRWESMDVMELGGTKMFTGDGYFESSLLLLDELWDVEFALQFPNGPVVGIPTNDVLTACDAGDTEALAQLRHGADTVLNSAEQPLARDLYARTPDGQWEVLGATKAKPQATPEPSQAFEPIEVSNHELAGGEILNSEQIGKMAASGYNWYPETQSFRKVAPTPGAPDRPWLEPDWNPPKKKGFLGRFR